MILHQVSNSYGNYNYNAYIYHNTSWPSHFHGNFELIYVFNGKTTISVNGEINELNKGELLILPPYTVHSINIFDSKTWIGVFSEDFIISFIKKHKYFQYSKFKCAPNIEEILKKHLFVQSKPDHFLLISYLYMVCNECVNNATLINVDINKNFIYKVINYIADNIDQDITLKNISDSMNYEYHYFSSLFNFYFSMNFKTFLNQLRFEKACALLCSNEKNITAIAQACGFGSIRNFNRVFKKISGVTPKEYKINHTYSN